MRCPFPRPHRADVLIAVAGLLSGLLLWVLGLYSNPVLGREHGALVLIPLVVMCVAVLGRRTGQPWALGIAVAALVGDTLTGSLLATIVLFTDVVYAAVLYGGPRLSRAVLPVSVALTVAVTIGTLAASRKPDALLLGAVCGLITVAPAWTAIIIRDHRNAAAAERLRAEQTALLAEMDRTQAVTAERARMARELHDLVANHLSAIAIHATAAQSLDDRATARDALSVIRENSVQGLAEMRRLIGILRDTSGDDEPSAAPTLAGLSSLVEQVRTSGVASGLSFVLRDETYVGGASALPAPIELTAYRVVQESLTNALKHAAPGEVTVRLCREDALTVRVMSPLGVRPGPRAPGSGAGLIGMRERVELLGGEFEAGPHDGSWLVRAVLPLEEGSQRTWRSGFWSPRTSRPYGPGWSSFSVTPRGSRSSERPGTVRRRSGWPVNCGPIWY
ncbi:sensor histidine kinase [Streptomyces gobiensis]|uniref:sensor histidine kinase n=1 Tax=Streptomyces gobiensis TaxID=2875706 RepID=UPI001E593977|nr:histidine kinase [Streptomyces gobiensis]UGY93665.1 histidine kinase [Streptomyces gobiensis]